MKTKDKILQSSLKLFNKRGIKSVSVRDICEDLQISPGNFSYHYPDKALIIKELYQMMTDEVYEAATAIPMDDANIIYFLETHKEVFHIQNKYRFFYLNFFEILSQYKEIKQLYLERHQLERGFAKQMIQIYIQKGVLVEMNDASIDNLVDLGFIVNNSWAIDAEIHFKGDQKAKLLHYLRICCGRLEPYLTPSSLKNYQQYFENL